MPDVPHEPHVGRHQDHDEREREQHPLDQLEGHAGDPPSARRQRVDDPLELDPPRRLDEDDVAGRDHGERDVDRGRGIGGGDDPVGRHARRERALGDPRGGATGAPSTTTRRSRTAAAACADLAMAGGVRVAELAHLAQDRDPPAAGSPASSSRAARTDSGAALYASSTIVTPPGADDRRRGAARATARARPADDLVEREPRGEAGGGPGERVVDRVPAEPGDLDRPVARGRCAGGTHAVDAARVDVVGADVGVGREAVGRRRGPRVRDGHPERPARRRR